MIKPISYSLYDIGPILKAIITYSLYDIGYMSYMMNAAKRFRSILWDSIHS